MDRKRRRQNGSLKKLAHRDGRLWWRFQWRKPGEKNATSKWLGQCSKMSKKNAEAEVARILEPINAGLEPRISSMMSLSDFLDATFLPAKRRNWNKDSTTPSSEDLIDNHLRPTLGRMLIHLITRRDLQGLLDAKADQGYSYSVVQHLHSFMLKIFAMAFADRLIQFDPAPSTVIPKCRPRKPKPIMTPEQIERVEQSLDIQDRLIFRFANTGGGMRPSEIEGIQLRDIKENKIHISRRIYRGKQGEEGELKSRRGERDVPLAPGTAALLKEYRKLIFDTRDTAWLFPSENPEKPLDYRNVFARRIKPALVKCGLQNINFQAMRRTFACESEKAMDAKTSAEILGHDLPVHNKEYVQKSFDEKMKGMPKLEKRLVQ